jgi:hypothetical protein
LQACIDCGRGVVGRLLRLIVMKSSSAAITITESNLIM